MTRVTTYKVRQVIITTDSVWDPNSPPERLALFDEEGNHYDLSNLGGVVGIPPGGGEGQTIVKNSDADFDAVWGLPPGGNDPNAMHFLGNWDVNFGYSWGNVVIDSGGLYILNAVDTLEPFQPAPSSETDPETANWRKIADIT